jgi:polyisoprenoid-binding protein YceI
MFRAVMSFLAARRWLQVALILAVLGGAAGGGYLLWVVFLHPAGPAAVTGDGLALPSVSGGPLPTPDPPGSQIERSWKVDTSIGSFADFTSSFVGYRVQEELVGIGGNTAVGRTPDVSGSMTTVGLTLTAAQFTANLQGLVSDESQRDSRLRQQSLETDRFPSATFVLTEPITLPADSVPGEIRSVTARGDLTLHGQTHPIEIQLTGKLAGEVLVVVGSLDLTFADFGIEKPESFKVLSVADHGIMEVQLLLTQA